MNRVYLSVITLFLTTAVPAQELNQVSFSNATTLSSLSFITDQQIIIKITSDGNLAEWGIEMDHRRYNYYPGRLDAYLGRVDRYGPEYDSVLRGKVKSIGTCQLTYYSGYEKAEKAGKLRSVGRVLLDYYENYENPALRGKLRFAGSIVFSYYSSSENEAFSGKLKSIQNTSITYYSSFDDKYIRGKIKSIGPNGYTWFTQNDSRGYPGGLRSGQVLQYINGISYLIM